MLSHLQLNHCRYPINYLEPMAMAVAVVQFVNFGRNSLFTTLASHLTRISPRVQSSIIFYDRSTKYINHITGTNRSLIVKM